jgi:hypothetical protein
VEQADGMSSHTSSHKKFQNLDGLIHQWREKGAAIVHRAASRGGSQRQQLAVAQKQRKEAATVATYMYRERNNSDEEK